MYLAAIVREDGIQVSVVYVADALWAATGEAIKELLDAKAMDAETLEQVPLGMVERRCAEFGEVAQWVATLNADED